MEAIARQPEAAGDISMNMIIIAAFVEGVAPVSYTHLYSLMKFLFIGQGEGRGHLTQAITLEEILRRNGHEVVEVLVGKSSSRRLTGFFNGTRRRIYYG